MEERRNIPEGNNLSRDLVKKGIGQLEDEIQIIEGWINNLDQAREDNPEALAARKTYNDMLQSRQDLLQALGKK